MKGQIAAKTPEEYIAKVSEARRGDIARLHALIRKTIPRESPHISSGVLAYGHIHYRYPSGREGDCARIAVASNASYISLYAMGADRFGWVPERYRSRLPKAKIGKSCVTFKRFDDLDVRALADLLKETVRAGFVSEVKADAKGGATKKAAAKKPPATTIAAKKKPAAKNAKPAVKRARKAAGR